MLNSLGRVLINFSLIARSLIKDSRNIRIINCMSNPMAEVYHLSYLMRRRNKTRASLLMMTDHVH
jgi:hypothetical protein